MPSQAQIRERITNQIVEHLKAEKVAPWRCPWIGHPNAGPPTNVVSNKRYRGINVLLLRLQQLRYGLKSKFFGTFNQWKGLCAHVKPRPSDGPPGQWGCQVIFFKKITRVDRNERGEDVEVEYPLLRTYTVFSVDQVEGKHLDRFRFGEFEVNPDFIDFHPAEKAIAATGADTRLGGEQAYYRRSGDYICCPEKQRFPQEKEFYAALLHELGHWSESRLDWKGSYAEGELRAEMAAAFALAELGVPQSDDLSNATAYLSSWLQAMQNDPRFIFRASTDASTAATIRRITARQFDQLLLSLFAELDFVRPTRLRTWLDRLHNAFRDQPLANPRNRAQTHMERPGDLFVRAAATSIALIGQQQYPGMR